MLSTTNHARILRNAASFMSCHATPPVRNLSLADTRRYLEKVPRTTTSTLPNGFRIACEEKENSEVATVGIWIDAGSRYETPEVNGTAHFLEHMNFKGTEKMTRKDMERKFEEIGGHLNAYTARDRTAYYVKVFREHVPAAVGVLADILRNSKVASADLEAERSTILEEMREVELLVDEVVMDNLHISAYRGCSLGLTILGPEENILRRINRSMIRNFVATHYKGPRMVLVGAGAVSHNQLESLAVTHFGDLPADRDPSLWLPAQYSGSGQYALWSAELPTVHLAWAFETCGIGNTDVFALQVVQHLFGGLNHGNRDLMAKQRFWTTQCLSPETPIEAETVAAERVRTPSKVRWQPDELVQLANPFFTPYVDTGLMGMYLVAFPGKVETHLRRTLRAFTRLTETLLEDEELNLAKANLKSALLINVDGTTNVAEDIGRQMLHTNYRLSLPEYFERIEAIDAAQIREVMRKYFNPWKVTVSSVGPVHGTPYMDFLHELVHQEAKI